MQYEYILGILNILCIFMHMLTYIYNIYLDYIYIIRFIYIQNTLSMIHIQPGHLSGGRSDIYSDIHISDIFWPENNYLNHWPLRRLFPPSRRPNIYIYIASAWIINNYWNYINYQKITYLSNRNYHYHAEELSFYLNLIGTICNKSYFIYRQHLHNDVGIS